MPVTITSAAEWAEAIDEEMRHFRMTDHRVRCYEIIMWAYAKGSAAGVEIAREAVDNASRRLTSADGRWVVRYDELNDWWVPEVSFPGPLAARVPPASRARTPLDSSPGNPPAARAAGQELPA
jgi:hypothetical protein